jgi:tetratricopeptide (TPR) repeat protein
MGEVFRAEDTKLRRPVALKLVSRHVGREGPSRERLLREARSASRLNHPNIVTIYAIEEVAGEDFIVMELVPGEPLRALLHRGPLDLARLLDLGGQIAGALAAAHAAGIIHRDIKPANILVTPAGSAKVLDFGLAKEIDPARISSEAEPLTETGAAIGTVAYMSPEQTRGEMLDARTDIFSLGTLLYEAATGVLPFRGPSALAVMHEISTYRPPDPSALRPDLPPELDALLEHAMAKERERRFPSAAQLATALRDLGRTRVAMPSQPTAELPNVPFVGRNGEIAELGRMLRDAEEGLGKIAFLTGEPGIGKTAVAEGFLRLARASNPNLLWARGRCIDQYGPGEAFLPFLDALGMLLAGSFRSRVTAALRSQAPTWCLQFPATQSSSGTGADLVRETLGATRERMLRELGDLLESLATSTAVVLLLEDLHWADPSSIDALAYLSRRPTPHRLLVVGTYRPADLRPDHPLQKHRLEMESHRLCKEIPIPALGVEDVAEYLRVCFSPNDFPADLAAALRRRTEGHPLFLSSLTQLLCERGDLVKREGRWVLQPPINELSGVVPASVLSVIRRKLEALSPEDRQALEFASVEGEEFTSSIASRLLQTDELVLEERLQRMAQYHRLIEPAGDEELPNGSLATRYRFAHALYQNVLYGNLAPKRRSLLHRQVGEALLEQHGPAAARIASQLAVHFEGGRDFERAVEFYVHAGDNAARRYAFAEAKSHYTRALELSEKLPPEARLSRLAGLYQKRANAESALGRYDAAAEEYEQMLAAARAARSAPQEAAALSGRAFSYLMSHRLDEATRATEEALVVAEREGNPSLRAAIQSMIVIRYAREGELDKCVKLIDELLPIARSSGSNPLLNQILPQKGMQLSMAGDYAHGEVFAAEGAAIAEQAGDYLFLTRNRWVLGLLRGNLGRVSAALSILGSCRELCLRNGDHRFAAVASNSMGWLFRELQDFEKAKVYDGRAVELARKAGWLEPEANSLINVALDHVESGSLEDVAGILREVEGIFDRDVWFRWRYNIRLQAAAAEYALCVRDLSEAETRARRALEAATTYQAGKYVIVAQRLLGEIAMRQGALAGAEAALGVACDELLRRPMPLVAWKVYASLGRLRTLQGRAEAAAAAFADARRVIEQIAASVTDEAQRRAFLDAPAVREIRT